MSPLLRLLLVDNDPIFRTGFRAVCEQFPDFQAVLEAETASAALQILKAPITNEELLPNGGTVANTLDLVVLDINSDLFAGENPSQVFSELKETGGIENEDISPLPRENEGVERGVVGDRSSKKPEIEFCQQLKIIYPNLPLLVLTFPGDPGILAAAREVGVDGYCPKGVAVGELAIAIRRVAGGESYWGESTRASQLLLSGRSPSPLKSRTANFLKNLGAELGKSGLRQIDRALSEASSELEECQQSTDSDDLTSVLNLAIARGRRRELQTARWIVSQLLPESVARENGGGEKTEEGDRALLPDGRNSQEVSTVAGEGNDASAKELVLRKDIALAVQSPVSGMELQAVLFHATAAKLESSNLLNATGIPLEIDILRSGRKRELINIVLRKLEEILGTLRSVKIEPEDLLEKRSAIVSELWSEAIADFIGKSYRLKIIDGRVSYGYAKALDRLDDGEVDIFGEISIVGNPPQPPLERGEKKGSFRLDNPPQPPLERGEKKGNRSQRFWERGWKEEIEVVPLLLLDSEMVSRFILDKIPLVEELCAHLLFAFPLIIDNVSYAAGSVDAMRRAEALLQNLAIQVANGVMLPLLNNLADVEEIKESFYDRQLISTREIERFRNSLSWRYRLQRNIWEPKAIFESSFSLLVLSDRGFEKISIYAPRRQELAELSGVRLIVTLTLETRDAIAPGVRAVISFIGTGVVYLLTQVVGRGIGLIGRGIIQGIGNSFQDIKQGKNKK